MIEVIGYFGNMALGITAVLAATLAVSAVSQAEYIISRDCTDGSLHQDQDAFWLKSRDDRG